MPKNIINVNSEFSVLLAKQMLHTLVANLSVGYCYSLSCGLFWLLTGVLFISGEQKVWGIVLLHARGVHRCLIYKSDYVIEIKAGATL